MAKILSPDELSTNTNAFLEVGDRLIDELFDTSQEFIDDVYAADIQGLNPIEFGGGVFGITCRSILLLTKGNAKTLNKMMGRRGTSSNISQCSAFLSECKSAMDNSPYG